MLRNVLKRLALGLSAGLVLTFLTFVLMSFSQERVARGLLGEHSSPDAVQAKIEELGLDRPLLLRFGSWLTDAAKGDLGTSWLMSAPVSKILTQRISVTLSLVLLSLLLSMAIAVVIGLVAANEGRTVERVLDTSAILAFAIPSFWLAMLLVSVIAIRMDVLPATGFVAISDDPAGWLRSLILPVLALSAGIVASISQQVRNAASDTLKSEYIRTFRARGVPGGVILFKHVLKNSSSAALTVVSLQFINVLGGSVVIEKVFALNGIGDLIVNSGRGGDQPVVLAVVLVMVCFVVLVNFLVDVTNSALNPKIRLGE